MEPHNTLRSALEHRTFDSGGLSELQSLWLRSAEAFVLLALGLLLARLLIRDPKQRSKAGIAFAASELAVSIGLPASSLLPPDTGYAISGALTAAAPGIFLLFCGWIAAVRIGKSRANKDKSA